MGSTDFQWHLRRVGVLVSAGLVLQALANCSGRTESGGGVNQHGGAGTQLSHAGNGGSDDGCGQSDTCGCGPGLCGANCQPCPGSSGSSGSPGYGGCLSDTCDCGPGVCGGPCGPCGGSSTCLPGFAGCGALGGSFSGGGFGGNGAGFGGCNTDTCMCGPGVCGGPCGPCGGSGGSGGTAAQSAAGESTGGASDGGAPPLPVARRSQLACYTLAGHASDTCLPVDDSLLAWLSPLPANCSPTIVAGPEQMGTSTGLACCYAVACSAPGE
jgi:hypothetical protein